MLRVNYNGEENDWWEDFTHPAPLAEDPAELAVQLAAVTRERDVLRHVLADCALATNAIWTVKHARRHGLSVSLEKLVEWKKREVPGARAG